MQLWFLIILSISTQSTPTHSGHLVSLVHNLEAYGKSKHVHVSMTDFGWMSQQFLMMHAGALVMQKCCWLKLQSSKIAAIHGAFESPSCLLIGKLPPLCPHLEVKKAHVRQTEGWQCFVQTLAKAHSGPLRPLRLTRRLERISLPETALLRLLFFQINSHTRSVLEALGG